MSLALGATWSLRAHYFDEDALPPASQGPGREGPAVCNGNIHLYDAAGINAYGRPGYRRGGSVRVADLPMCKHCAKRKTS